MAEPAWPFDVPFLSEQGAYDLRPRDAGGCAYFADTPL